METGDVKDGEEDRCVKEAGRGDGLDNTFLTHSSQPQTRSMSSFTAESHENQIVVTAKGGVTHWRPGTAPFLPPSLPSLSLHNSSGILPRRVRSW